MAMPNVQLDIYEYSVSNIILTSPKWSNPYIIESSKIKVVNIYNNYETNFAPDMSIECNVSYETYYEILANSKNIEASFIISLANTGSQEKASSASADEKSSNTNHSFATIWAECKMQIFDKGYLESRDVVDTETDRSNPEATEGTEMLIKLYLIDSRQIKKAKENHSYIISGNMNDTLFELISSRDMNNFLMSSSDAEEATTYAIPYGDILQNLKTLNAHYGIYDYSYLFYIGIDRNYLLSKGDLGKAVAFGEHGTVNIYIEPYDAENPAIGNGCYIDELNKVYVLGNNTAVVDNVDSLLDYAMGDKITTVVAGTQKHFTDSIGESGIESAYLVSNEKLRMQYINSMKEAKRTVTLSFTGINLSIISPNKKYRLLADERYYNNDYDLSGFFRLVSSNIILSNSGEGSFKVNASINLCKQG